jgi:hypothetical protein
MYHPDKVHPAFASATVLGLDGTPTPLEALWRDAPALIVFVRHYG